MNRRALCDTVCVIGAGTIGVGWCVVFACAGYEVRLYDPTSGRLAAARREVESRLADMVAGGRIGQGDVSVALERLCVGHDLQRCVVAASYIQECAPEQPDLKRELLAEVDAYAADSAVLASSSSAIPPSELGDRLPGRRRFLVVHPANPPHLLRVVELVPAHFTDRETVARAEQVMRQAGRLPVRVSHEPEGFIFNRLQGAVLREAYCLVRDGIASVADIDLVMTAGLGRRWAVAGPFETADLNARGGIHEHAERMGETYARLGADRGQDDPWTAALVEHVHKERRRLVPLDDWGRAVQERDRRLLAIAKALD